MFRDNVLFDDLFGKYDDIFSVLHQRFRRFSQSASSLAVGASCGSEADFFRHLFIFRKRAVEASFSRCQEALPRRRRYPVFSSSAGSRRVPIRPDASGRTY